jgi:hypothetical protein
MDASKEDRLPRLKQRKPHGDNRHQDEQRADRELLVSLENVVPNGKRDNERDQRQLDWWMPNMWSF